MSGKKRKTETAGDGPRALFVCVRDRHGKGASCAGSGARALLSGMQNLLAAESIGKEELLLLPVGCLGLCKQGPVLVAAAGEAAAQKKPGKPGKHAPGVYTRVVEGEMREVLREALCGSLQQMSLEQPK